MKNTPGTAPGPGVRSELTRRTFLTFAVVNTAACGGGGGGTSAEATAPGPSGLNPPPVATPGSPAPPPPAAVGGNAGPFIAQPSTTLATLTLLSSGAGVLPWSVGQAFVSGDMPFGAQLDGVQMTVKSRWPDGSAKIAVLAGITAVGGASHSVALGPGTSPAGALLTTSSLKATGVSASIDTDRYGSASWSGNDWDSPLATWVSGTVMSSWIYRKPLGADAHLTAWLEVRLWATGDVEVLPWIENGFLMVAGPGGRPGNYRFTLNGTERFAMTLPVFHHTRAPLISGEALSHWAGPDRTAVPKHDVAYLERSGLVQTYMKSLRRNWPALPAWRGVSASFSPYQSIDGTTSMHSPSMGQPGAHPSVGAQPGWEAIALLDDSALGFTQMIRESYRFGGHQIHYRDEATGRAIRFSQHADTQIRPEYVLSNIGEIQDGASVRTPAIVDGKGGDGNRWTGSHQPAGPLLAYLTTGRWWFMEECQHIAAVNFLILARTRKGAQMLVTPDFTQLRQAAWTLRNLFIADCVTPDDDELKTEYATAINNNIDFYHRTYIASPSNPMGLIENKRDTARGGDQAWQYDFWTAAWGRAIAFRVGDSKGQRKKAREFFDWVARSCVGRVGGTGPEEFLYRFATTTIHTYPSPDERSYLWAGKDAHLAYPDYAGGTGPWFANWGEFYQRRIVVEQGYTGAKVDGDIVGSSMEPGGWWAVYIEALMACVSLRVDRSLEGLNRLKTTDSWRNWWSTGAVRGAFRDQYPHTGVDYTLLEIEDLNQVMPGVGQRANVNLNSSEEVDYDKRSGLFPGNVNTRWWLGYGAGSDSTAFESLTYSYSGTVWAPEYGGAGALISNGGGHGGAIGMMSYLFDFATLRWRQVGAPRNLPATAAWAGYAVGAREDSYVLSNDRREQNWNDFNYEGSYIKLGVHTYLQNAYIAPSEGGGPSGSLLLPESDYRQDPAMKDPRTGISRMWAPHLKRLDDGTMSRAAVAPFGEWGQVAGRTVVKDTRRKRLWFFENGVRPDVVFHDLTSGPPYTRSVHTVRNLAGARSSSWWMVYNGTWLYVPEVDCIVAFGPTVNGGYPGTRDMPLGVQVLSMSTGVPVDLERQSAIPTQPMSHGGCYVGAAWCPPLKKFYIYQGMRDTYCHVLTPSSLDFATCSWSWSREEFGGVPAVSRHAVVQDVANAQLNGVLGRWAWVPAYSSFAWHDGPETEGVCADGVVRKGIVQLWRPPGAAI